MIITPQIMKAAGACDEALNYFDVYADKFYGLKRRDFVIEVQRLADSQAQPDWWPQWCKDNLAGGLAVLRHGKLVRTGKYKVSFPNGEEQIFLVKDEAVAAAKVIRDAQIAADHAMFHVHARNNFGATGFELVGFCDTELDIYPKAEYYGAFNHKTGLYEPFKTYVQAKARMLALRSQREEIHSHGYVIWEQIREIDDPDEDYPLAWVPIRTLHRRLSPLDELDAKAPLPATQEPRFI